MHANLAAGGKRRRQPAHSACTHPLPRLLSLSLQAPGGVSARCPYCQASALQVYLRPLPSSPAESEAEEGAAADGACEAAADSDAPPAAADLPAHPPSSGNGSDAARAACTASSELSMGSLELDSGAGVSVTAFLAPAPAAAAREAVRQHQEALRSGCIPGAAGGSCGSGRVRVTLSLGCDLRLLAEAAAEASRAQGPAIVAMVRRADQPDSGSSSGSDSDEAASSGEAASRGEAAGSSDSEPGGGSRASDMRPPAVDEQPDTPATELAAQTEAPSLPAEGGPAVLQLPDGSQQLVLLRSAQQVAEEEAAAAARARDEAAAAAGAAAAATYQPPATAEDERMRSAIAQADAALLQHQPPAPSRQPGDDWLERMRQADAALQAAVARRDAERFGSGGGGSGDGGSGSH